MMVAVGHNPTLTLAAGGSSPPGFQIPFPCIIWWPNLFLFRSLFSFYVDFLQHWWLLEVKTFLLYYFFTFWFKGLIFKTQLTIKFWPPENRGQLVLEYTPAVENVWYFLFLWLQGTYMLFWEEKVNLSIVLLIKNIFILRYCKSIVLIT